MLILQQDEQEARVESSLATRSTTPPRLHTVSVCTCYQLCMLTVPLILQILNSSRHLHSPKSRCISLSGSLIHFSCKTGIPALHSLHVGRTQRSTEVYGVYYRTGRERSRGGREGKEVSEEASCCCLLSCGSEVHKNPAAGLFAIVHSQ